MDELEKYLEERREISLRRIKECLNPCNEINAMYIIYFLNSLRNLLEIDYQEDRYNKLFTLNFFANWCLHARIDRMNYKNITDTPNEQFNESNKIREKKGLSQLGEDGKKHFYLEYIGAELMELTKLRKQITGILTDNRISTDLIMNDEWWVKFRNRLIETLESSPHIIKDNQKSLIKFLVMNKDPYMEKSNPLSYVGTVDIIFNDEEVISIDLLDSSTIAPLESKLGIAL